jgi:hypothetical protein
MREVNDDQPLDPAAARLIRNVRLLMAISVSVTVIVIGVVLAIVGYRLSGSVESNVESLMTLPKGARVISTAVAEDRIAVTIDTGGAVEIRTFDLRSLKPVGRLRFATEP